MSRTRRVFSKDFKSKVVLEALKETETLESLTKKYELLLEHNATDEEINAMRRANKNVLIEVQPGIIYVGPGGGLVASGHSGAAVNSHLDNLRNLKDLETKIKIDPEAFLKPLFADLTFITNNQLDFEMKNNGLVHYLHEKNNNFKVILNQ